jgi:hypothetical protein
MTLKTKHVSNLTHMKQTNKEYKQYTNNSTKSTFKPHDVTVNILSPACGHKMSNYVAFNNR